MKDKSSLSEDEMDDNSSFQLELSQEDRNLEDKEMEVSDQTLCEAAEQSEGSAAVMAAKTAMTSKGQGEGHMPPPLPHQAPLCALHQGSPRTWWSTQGHILWGLEAQSTVRSPVHRLRPLKRPQSRPSWTTGTK